MFNLFQNCEKKWMYLYLTVSNFYVRNKKNSECMLTVVIFYAMKNECFYCSRQMSNKIMFLLIKSWLIKD